MRPGRLALAGLLSGLLQVCVQAQCNKADPEAILHQLLGNQYRRALRPDHFGPPTQVSVQLDIQSLVAVDPKSAYYEVMGYWRTSWVDPRLKYEGLENASCFPKLKLNLTEAPDKPPTSSLIWTPDLYFDNAKTEFYGLYYFWVEPSGKVLRSILIKHQFECKMNFQELPFDCHHCPIRLLSYSETSSKVTLIEKDGKGMTLNESGKAVTEWSIQQHGSEVVKTLYGTGHDRYSWDSLRLDIVLSRTALYHMRTDVFYTILFVLMPYYGFFISRFAAPARVTIAVIPVLTIVNLLNYIDSQLPRIRYSWLSIFLTTSLVFSVSAVVEYGIVWMLLTTEDCRKEHAGTVQDLAQRLVASRPVRESREEDCTALGVTVMVDEAKVPSLTHRNGASQVDSVSSQERRTQCLRPSQEAVFNATYKIFDPGERGSVTAEKMRIGLRRLNLYYTPEQIAEIFEMMGVDEGDGMSKHQFVDCMAIMPVPAAASDRGFFDQPPSLCLDILTRSAYLPLYAALLLAMWIWSMPWTCDKSPF